MPAGEGSVFGKYNLLTRIASGGMGEIYLAKLKGPSGFEKLLVIKRILEHHIENQEFVDMFFSEARVAAQLSHANIAQIFEMGEIDGSYYIAMEYVHGKPLRAVLDRARERGEYLHPAHVIEIIGKLCDGLSYAHNARNMSGEPIGIIHRDINPHNILISYSGEVKIIDFGIAKSQLSTNKTEVGMIKGKFYYMSPEQGEAKALDKRSDIFSVGICLYEALSFVNPFAKPTIMLSLNAIQSEEPPSLAQTKPRLAPLEPIVRRALAKSRDERYADCSELRRDLMKLSDSGALGRAPEQLADYVHDLFEEEIQDEKRTILESDSVNTSQIELMQQAVPEEEGFADPSLASLAQEVRPTVEDAGQLTDPEAHVARRQPEQHSRVPFLLLLLGIVASSLLTAATVYNQTRAARIRAMEAAPTVLPVPPPGGKQPGDRPATRVEQGANSDRQQSLEQPTQAAQDTPSARKAQAAHEEIKGKADKRNTSQRANRRGSSRRGTSPATLATLQITTEPKVPVFRGGSAVGKSLKLKSSTGKLEIGTGAGGESDPFVVKLRYRLEEDAVRFDIESKPWAIVRGNGGIGLGRTPLSGQKGGAETVFELINPKEGLKLRLELRLDR